MWLQYTIDKPWNMNEVDRINHPERRWHYLFEPELLVRVEKTFGGAVCIPLYAKWGDLSKARTGASGGGDIWPGDKDFYKTDELCEANLDFLHAGAKLVQVLRKEGKNHYEMQRKHTHLLCNQYGMNYLQEAWFYFRSFWRSLYLFRKYGKQ